MTRAAGGISSRICEPEAQLERREIQAAEPRHVLEQSLGHRIAVPDQLQPAILRIAHPEVFHHAVVPLEGRLSGDRS